MSKDKVIDSLIGIEDDMVQAVDALRSKKRRPVWIKWGSLAACLCVLITVLTVYPHLFQGETHNPIDNTDPLNSVPSHSEGIDKPEGPYIPWIANFNPVNGVMDAARRYIPGYFTEELNDEELNALQPDKIINGLHWSGYAGFDGDGQLIDVILTISTTIPDANVYVTITEGGVMRDYIMDMVEPEISVCQNIEYKAYQWVSADKSVLLAADAKINGYGFAFTLEVNKQDIEQAKVDLSRILECFAYYADGSPDLTTIVADSIPEWFDKSLSHHEALEDPDYGAYMLPIIPNGFAPESIRRYKDQNADYLSGLWTSGYDELRWKVYTISEADKVRLTSVEDTVKYDLSLYPIPRASSVPDELREIVDNPIFDAGELTMDAVWARAYKTGESDDSSGWRMAFSVRYGDIIVEVRTKGVDPEWVYMQLMEMLS